MIILGIETSCDETAAAVIRGVGNKIKVLSNVVASQIKIHAPWGGVVPTLAKREHLKNLPIVCGKALKEAKVKFEKIDVIAVTVGPGLEPALWTGINFAADLAKKWNKPVVAVNHMEGHIASVFLKNGEFSIFNFSRRGGTPPRRWQFSNKSNKQFPILALLVSGGHTELVLIKNPPTGGGRDYKVIGSTRDDAAGEAFDKVARLLNIGYPGGPVISAYAEKLKVKSEKLKINLPRPMINSGDYDFSFSGLKTAVRYKLEELGKINKRVGAEICAEFQQAVIDVLISKTLRAAKEYKVKTIILAGGVAANKELRKQMAAAANSLIPNSSFLIPELRYTGDNAAMIALAAYFRVRKKTASRRITKPEDLNAEGNLELK